MTFRWSRDQIEKLISCIEQYPEVYNTKSKKYAEKNKRVEAFNVILEYIQQTVSPDITLYEIKRKWKNLRTQYTQELRTINQTKESESGMVDVYIPKLWCFRQLNFLQSHTEGRSKCHTEDDESNLASSQEDAIISDVHPKKRIRSLFTDSAFRRDDLSSTKNIPKQEKPELKFAWLGNLVANQMEQISPEDQDAAAWEVQSLMRRLTAKRTLSTTTSSQGITINHHHYY